MPLAAPAPRQAGRGGESDFGPLRNYFRICRLAPQQQQQQQQPPPPSPPIGLSTPPPSVKPAAPIQVQVRAQVAPKLRVNLRLCLRSAARESKLAAGAEFQHCARGSCIRLSSSSSSSSSLWTRPPRRATCGKKGGAGEKAPQLLLPFEFALQFLLQFGLCAFAGRRQLGGAANFCRRLPAPRPSRRRHV